MSHCLSAIVAAKKAVSAPIPATTALATGASAYSTLQRAVRYTPAVTMVAAWIKAETGVGPAIASGNQTNNGTWALLPQAPTNNNKAMAVMTPKAPTASTGFSAACASRLGMILPPILLSTKLTVVKVVNTTITPIE